MIEFITALKKFGYSVDLSFSAEDSAFGNLTGGKLGDLNAMIRAREDFCNIGIILGLFDAVRERDRYSLLFDLLQLNFNHPLSRVSLFRATPLGGKDPVLGILIAETSFFWKPIPEDQFDKRVSALMAIAKAASSALAAKGAISATNPFFKELRPIESPIEREDISGLGDAE